jgi:dihydrofolate synthase/folylpolyglutamate synthase
MGAYEDTLADLYRRGNAGIKLGLDTMSALLAALGHPQRSLRCVVVAGTNGKGSTSSLISSALGRAGHRVGLYTSPHLLRFTERIRIAGQELAPERVVALATRLREAEARCPRSPTFFECATALALVAFAEARVDAAVLEVGLGGRLDATNVVDKWLSVITPIDYDHQEYLGDSLAAIAAEKAAIIGAGRPVVVAPQAPEAHAVIAATATARGASLYRAGPDVPVPPGLPPYQVPNFQTAAAACAVIDRLGLTCGAATVREAMASFAWAGRYQWLAGAPPVLLDGAHNPAGSRALVAALDADPRVAGRRIQAVFSAVRGKDAAAMLEALTPRLAGVHLCPLASRRGRAEDELRALAPTGAWHPTAAAALEAARAAAGPRGLVLVTGSLFLVADALAEVTGEPRDPAIDG